MPVEAAAGNILQVTINGTLDNQHVMTVLHYRINELGTNTQLKDVCDGLNAYFAGSADDLYDLYLSCCSNEYDADPTFIQRIYPIRQIAYAYPPNGSGGTDPEESLPPGVSVALTKRAEGTDRHCIGGVRMPAVPRNRNDGGLLSVSGTAFYDALAEVLAAQVTLGDGCILDPIILNRGAPGSSQIVYQVLTQPSLRTMSRRVVGRGI